MNTVPVVAVIRSKNGKEADLEKMLKELVAATHQEKGCVLYALHKTPAESHTFVFIEKWRSQKDLDAHLGSEHIARALARKEELIESLDIFPLVGIPIDKSTMESF
ncbi:MAG: hypothetical protein KCHDKBKB_01456 [Elusimicrobia bacterium]|nr:hypothetical protein [Elusimicrobiota bacterium]